MTLVKGQGQDTSLNHKQSLNQIRASSDSPFQSYSPDMNFILLIVSDLELIRMVIGNFVPSMTKNTLTGMLMDDKQ